VYLLLTSVNNNPRDYLAQTNTLLLKAAIKAAFFVDYIGSISPKESKNE
jgi:hypothetical protein